MISWDASSFRGLVGHNPRDVLMLLIMELNWFFMKGYYRDPRDSPILIKKFQSLISTNIDRLIDEDIYSTLTIMEHLYLYFIWFEGSTSHHPMDGLDWKQQQIIMWTNKWWDDFRRKKTNPPTWFSHH